MIAAVIAAIATPARADPPGTAEIRAFDNATSIEYGLAHLYYAETYGGQKADTERAWLPTLSFGTGLIASDAARGPWRNLYVHFDLSVSGGVATYDGATCNGFSCSPVTTDDDTALVQTALQVGRGYAFGSRGMLIPFGEFDYRYWFRNLQGGYIEHYSNLAGLVGLKVQYNPAPHWVWSVSGAAGSTFGADMTTNGVDFPLGSALILRGQARVGLRLTDRLTATGTLGYESFSYGQSATTFNGFCAGVGGCLEPNSTTEQVTLTTGFAYRF